MRVEWSERSRGKDRKNERKKDEGKNWEKAKRCRYRR